MAGAMMEIRHEYCWPVISLLVLLALAGCAHRGLPPESPEPVPPVSAQTWREIEEQIWTASTLAQAEAEAFARAAMGDWMRRVREKTETEFVPWYTGYWAQQWLGLKAGWYEMGREEGDPPLEDYLVGYLQERYDELVLQPAGEESDPQRITRQAAALYVRLLSEQLQRIPKMHAVQLRSLRGRLQGIYLIRLSGSHPHDASLFLLFERSDLTGLPAYEALLAGTDSAADQEGTSPGEERLQVVAEDTLARLLGELPVHAGGNAASLVVDKVLGVFISAGVVVWSAVSHDRQRPEIEAQLREALDAGLDEMWQVLMEDPQLGVLSPVFHMTAQIETGLFPPDGSPQKLTF
jgi:hypothetical protein